MDGADTWQGWALYACRVVPAVAWLPWTGRRVVGWAIGAGFALPVAWYVVPRMSDTAGVFGAEAVVRELALGLLLAGGIRACWSVFSAAAAAAWSVVPRSAGSSESLELLYTLLGTAGFCAVGGHRFVARSLVGLYGLVPMGAPWHAADGLAGGVGAVLAATGAAAVTVAAPAWIFALGCWLLAAWVVAWWGRESGTTAALIAWIVAAGAVLMAWWAVDWAVEALWNALDGMGPWLARPV